MTPRGSFLNFTEDFAGDLEFWIDPHRHNSHEFYYVLEGSGVMRVADSRAEIGLKDLVSVPRNVAHTLKAGPEGIRCLAFAASFMQPGEMHTPVELSDVD